MDRSLFVDSFYFANIVEADTMTRAKELRFYIETQGKILKVFKCINDTVLYVEKEKLKMTGRILCIYSSVSL